MSSNLSTLESFAKQGFARLSLGFELTPYKSSPDLEAHLHSLEAFKRMYAELHETSPTARQTSI